MITLGEFVNMFFSTGSDYSMAYVFDDELSWDDFCLGLRNADILLTLRSCLKPRTYLKEKYCNAPVKDSPDEDMLRDCQYFRQKTNRDALRNMTDEELAAWFTSISDCKKCMIWDVSGCWNGGSDCKDKWMEWLRGEVKR